MKTHCAPTINRSFTAHAAVATQAVIEGRQRRNNHGLLRTLNDQNVNALAYMDYRAFAQNHDITVFLVPWWLRASPTPSCQRALTLERKTRTKAQSHKATKTASSSPQLLSVLLSIVSPELHQLRNVPGTPVIRW